VWKRERLRGCIGQREATEPLARVVAHCACDAALEDPRFEPVIPAELTELEIEISVLSAPFRIAPLQVTAQVNVGEHGLIISRGNYRESCCHGMHGAIRMRASTRLPPKLFLNRVSPAGRQSPEHDRRDLQVACLNPMLCALNIPA
jgi:hypothetical protein